MTNTQPAGYIALPQAGSGSPVLVLHAWWGLNETIRDLCDRLAAHGFIAFAPDLYHGRVAVTIPEAEQYSSELDDEKAHEDVRRAAAYVDRVAGEPGFSLAVIGFSLGAHYAARLAANDPDHVRSVVMYYGATEGDFSRARAEFLGHFAENDVYEEPEYIEYLEETLRELGLSVTFYSYPGVGHWFCEPDRADAYQPEAESLAWERTLAFLRR